MPVPANIEIITIVTIQTVQKLSVDKQKPMIDFI